MSARCLSSAVHRHFVSTARWQGLFHPEFEIPSFESNAVHLKYPQLLNRLVWPTCPIRIVSKRAIDRRQLAPYVFVSENETVFIIAFSRYEMAPPMRVEVGKEQNFDVGIRVCQRGYGQQIPIALICFYCSNGLSNDLEVLVCSFSKLCLGIPNGKILLFFESSE